MPRLNNETRAGTTNAGADAPEAIVAVDPARGVLLCLLCCTGVGTAAAHFRNRHQLKGAPL